MDAYDAMSSDRSYRKAMLKDVIRNELIRNKGSQFDPNIADVFLNLFDSGTLDHIQNDQDSKSDVLDVHLIINDILAQNTEPGTIKMNQEEISKLYRYVEGMNDRYGITYRTILISLIWEDETPMKDISQAMKAM